MQFHLYVSFNKVKYELLGDILTINSPRQEQIRALNIHKFGESLAVKHDI